MASTKTRSTLCTLAFVSLCCVGADVFAQEAPKTDATKPETTKTVDASKTPTTDATKSDTAKDKTAAKDAVMGPQVDASMTPEQRKAVEAYRAAYGMYERESQDYSKTVDEIVEAKYRQRVAKINTAYNKDINTKTLIERKRRIDTIVAFEQFVKRYPRDKKYSPDALFRLAELYFEKANDEFLLADESFAEKLALYEAGKVADRPAEPTRSYDKTIQIFETLIKDWPDYRLLDGAYYLLAYCEQQRGNDDKARDTFLTLIAQRPKSKFVPEAWIRVGEFFFDLNELDKARQAYAEAMKFPKSRFYDKALYKLAWTYYRQDNFDKALGHFRELIEYSDAKEAKTGKSGSVLRAESVQYMAISLAEEDWDLDGVRDEAFGLERTKSYLPATKPYEREVLAQLSKYMFENKRFDESIAVIRYTLESYSKHPENPQLHERLVLALFRNDNLNAAFAERRNLGTLYGPSSAWHKAQKEKGNVEAMRYASNLVRDNLIQSATWFHEQAQKQRDEAIANQDEAVLKEAQIKYALAAKTYAEFIKKHPNDKDAFQWSFYYAECLFYSGQYMKAYAQYRSVRELDIKAKEFIDIQQTSAFNAVKALELKMEDLIKAGKIPANVLPNVNAPEAPTAPVKENKTTATGIVRAKAKTVPPIVLKYIVALDRYIVLNFKSDDPLLDPKLAFQAAKILYDFNQFPEARKRFDWIIKTYNKSKGEKEIAALSASLWLETYRVEQDYEALAELAKQLKDKVDVSSINEEIRIYELAALFKAAEAANAAKRYDEAITKYLELVSRDKKKKYTVKALSNAASASESLERYDQALRLFERVYQEFPKDPLASYALYRIAVNAEQFFEFDKAVQNYLAFYKRFAKVDTPKALKEGLDFDYAVKAPTALKNAAILLDDLQEYEKSAKRFTEFYSNYKTDKDAEVTAWRTIIAWKKADKPRDMIKAVEAYHKNFASAKTSRRVLESTIIVADYYLAAKNEKKAKAWYQKTLKWYIELGVKPGTDPAFYAAKAQFMLTEFDFARWDKIKIKGKLKAQKKALDARIKGQRSLTTEYKKVYAYQSLEWSMASGFREGNLFQRFAQSLYDATVPFKEGTDEWDIYRGQLDDLAVPLEDKAVEKYELIAKKARDEKIVNEWTKYSLSELNKYKPQEYPLFKEERQHVEEGRMSGLPMLDAVGYKRFLDPPKPKKEEN